MVELRLDGRQWASVNRSILDLNLLTLRVCGFEYLSRHQVLGTKRPLKYLGAFGFFGLVQLAGRSMATS